MSKSQSIRFRNTIVQIETIVLNGITCLRLKDVQRRFPSTVAFSIDEIQLSFVTDDNGDDLEPLRIVARPGQIIDIVEPVGQSTNELDKKIHDMDRKIDLILANTQETLSRLKHLMNQLYEIHEYTTPRYFFILPVEQYHGSFLDNITDLFLLHFKLYFLCECSDKPSELHIAPHEGYSIRRPKDFLCHYESYLRTTFFITRVLLTTTGFFVPKTRDLSKHFVDSVVPQVKRMDEDYLKNGLTVVATLLNTTEAVIDESEKIPFQGEQLRELESYLDIHDKQHSLGNLYRTVTSDGHVRWVCLQHYNSIGFHRKISEFIRQFESFGMKFNQETKEAIALDIQFTTTNLETLRDALTKGFNIFSLTFQNCSLNENDFDKLLDTIINRSSIRRLTILNTTIKTSKWWGMSENKYVCEYLIIRIQNQLLEIQVSHYFANGDMKMLSQILLQNKVCRLLSLSGSDFRHCVQLNQEFTTLIVNHLNNIEFLCDILSNATSLNSLKLCFWSSSSMAFTRFCQILAKTPSLTELHLMNHHCFDNEDFIVQLLTTLDDHPSIKHLTLHVYHMKPFDRKETSLINALSHRLFINCLHLSESVISDRFIQALIHASENTHSLTELQFYDCQINEDDISKLHLLATNGNLTHLVFSPEQYWSVVAEELHNNLYQSPYENTKLQEFIQQNGSRYGIDLTNQSLIDQDLEIIIQQAIINKQCKRLRLSSNKITSIGIAILSGALKNNNTMYALYLDSNHMYDEGVYFLIKTILYNNTTLKKLGLGHNGITDEGLKHLGQLMKVNKTITHLYLNENELTDNGIQRFAKSIQNDNGVIQQLDLSGHKLLSDQSIDSLLAMIEQNLSLLELKIYDCNLTEIGQQRLKTAEKLKKSFKIYVKNYLN